jgi:hypothetical protein
VETCSKDKSCHPDAVQGICTLSTTPQSDMCDGHLTLMVSELNEIWPLSSALSFGFRLMDWKSCGVSYDLIEKGYMHSSSRGASIWAKISSRYLLVPLNRNLVRLGRIERAIGGGGRLSRAG